MTSSIERWVIVGDVEYCNGAGGVGRRKYGIEEVRETKKGKTKIILVIRPVLAVLL